MKKLIRRASSVVFAAAAMAMGSASVAGADERIVATVPFAFIVQGVHLPAGDYVVTEMSSGVFKIANADGRQVVIVPTIPAPTSGGAERQPELVFERVSNQLFLMRIAPQQDETRDIVLAPSDLEREIHAGND